MTHLICLLLSAAPTSQPAPTVLVEGALVKKAALTEKDLAGLGAVTVDWSDKAGAHKVKGVRLDRILGHLGFNEGPVGPAADPKVKHEGLRAVVVAQAADGFQAVFSVGELLESLGATQVLVAWEVDGKALAPDVGPFRLVVTTDKRGSRSLHRLTALRVVDLRVSPAPASK
ncbi:MAG: molybdopterin-dependent oxidoreductase [Myxococcales bacterium]|nr:molybdopterin-dependent oxidoreductase [Myxococcales bacterium]